LPHVAVSPASIEVALVAALAILAFAWRGAIPAGVMLAPGPDGRFVLTVCWGWAS